MQLRGKTAYIVGRRHVELKVRDQAADKPLLVTSLNNRQDMIGTHFVQGPNGLEVAFVVHDGSSDSEKSEVGAGLFAEPAAVKFAQLVNEYGIESPTVASEMYFFYISMMRNVIALHPYGEYYLNNLDLNESDFPVDTDPRLASVYNWIKNHLLFCVVLGYVSPEGCRTLQRGDGGYMVDDQIVISQYDDVPPYIGYHFYPPAKLQQGIARLEGEGKKVTTLAAGFESKFYPNARRVAGFSDGMPLSKLHSVWDVLTNPLDWWQEGRNKLNMRARQWWQEYVNPDVPSDGWLISDDMSIVVFEYIDDVSQVSSDV